MSTDKENTEAVKAGQLASSDLIVEGDALQLPDADQLKTQSSPEQTEILNEALRMAGQASNAIAGEKAWLIARNKIERFKPLPWFLWRLSKAVFSKPPGHEDINEGMLLGLRRLVFAAASDPVLGSGTKINNLKKALEVLSPDVIAAVAVMHSVSKRLMTHGHESVWRSMLDDALISAQAGFELGGISRHVGKGRAMLSGFALNIGLAILIATGDQKQSQEMLEAISTGKDMKDAGMLVYGCEPLQISSVLLASCGCGPDAAAGLVQNNLDVDGMIDLKRSVSIWAASYKAIEILTKSRDKGSINDYLDLLGTDSDKREQLFDKSVKITRSGHSWEWIS